MGICATSDKSRCIDILIENFSVDNWLKTYVAALENNKGDGASISFDAFADCQNFSVDKLSVQI